MFGFVTVNADDLQPQESERYHQVYCGLCHTLGKSLGQHTRAALSNDLAFLALLLMSLYEPQETLHETGCIMHPVKKRAWTTNEYVEYAADLTVALAYHKCLDDWEDDASRLSRAAASALEGSYRTVKERHPQQCATIEQGLARIRHVEAADTRDPDAAANLFGTILGSLFVYRDDRWKDALFATGYNLGRFIYLMDAAYDLDKDRKSGSYNPFAETPLPPEEIRTLLTVYAGQAAAAFEKLPCVQDAHLLRNVLYSGVWVRLNQKDSKNGVSTQACYLEEDEEETCPQKAAPLESPSTVSA